MKKISLISICFLVVLLLSVPVMAANPNPDTQYAQGLVGFFERLFVPHDDYFIQKTSQLNDHINAKLGGVAYLYQMLNNFFLSLNMGDAAPELNFSLPDNYFFQGFQGFSHNLFGSSGAFIGLVKNVFGVFLCIVTAISCYHKLRTFFDK